MRQQNVILCPPQSSNKNYDQKPHYFFHRQNNAITYSGMSFHDLFLCFLSSSQLFFKCICVHMSGWGSLIAREVFQKKKKEGGRGKDFQGGFRANCVQIVSLQKKQRVPATAAERNKIFSSKTAFPKLSCSNKVVGAS